MKYFSGNRVNQMENKCLNGYLSPLYNLFFLMGIHSMQGLRDTTSMELHEKEAKRKITAYRKSA